MKIRLNTWQTLALFLPSVLGCIVTVLPLESLHVHETRFAIENLLLLFNILIVICYQTNLAFGFNRASSIESKLFKWNALIPLVFIALYFVFVIYLTFNRPIVHCHKNMAGPMIIANFDWSSWIVLLLIIHAFITFYFINNWFVAKKIKAIADTAEREKLGIDFLIPIKRLTKISLWLIGVFILLTALIDIINVKTTS